MTINLLDFFKKKLVELRNITGQMDSVNNMPISATKSPFWQITPFHFFKKSVIDFSPFSGS